MNQHLIDKYFVFDEHIEAIELMFLALKENGEAENIVFGAYKQALRHCDTLMGVDYILRNIAQIFTQKVIYIENTLLLIRYGLVSTVVYSSLRDNCLKNGHAELKSMNNQLIEYNKNIKSERSLKYSVQKLKKVLS